MEKITHIGNVKLDYGRYSGSDLYTDGDVELDILDMVISHPPSEYPEIIEKAQDWPYFYHLSPLRHNIVEWLPIEKNHKVLEIGSGCGAITGKIAEKAGEVVCVDLSETRSKINAHRHKEFANITIHIGNFADIEPDLADDFDFILFIGVFEYCCLYVRSGDFRPDAPYLEMLRIVKRHVKQDGHLAIAIENRYGLKYWAGCAEDHLGTFFSGLEDYPEGGNARTFTRRQLEKMLTAAGFGPASFYYPYPDYKFMTTLFSDHRLPKKGELYDNTRNFDRHRMELFNEKKVFDSIISEDLFPLFSNSYFVYTGKDTDTAYLRYANDRAPKYRVRTQITKDQRVFKTPLTSEASGHTVKMLESYRLLFNEFEKTKLMINKCKPAADGKSVEFEYIKGKTLSELLDACITQNCMLSFNDLLEEFIVLLELQDKFHPLLYNHDLIFSNIILDDKYHGQWTLIDYEWMLESEITKKENIYRALYCYLLEDDSRKAIDPAKLFARFGITETDIGNYRVNERKFQDMVAGGRMSAAEMRAAFGLIAVDPKVLVEPYIKRAAARNVQIFYDSGNGYSQAESIRLEGAYQNENDVLVDITIPGNVQRLRLDPADMACVVLVHDFKWNGIPVPLSKSYLKSNGQLIADGYYFFATADPQLYLQTNRLRNHDANHEANHLWMQLEVVILPKAGTQGLKSKAQAALRRFCD